MFVVRALPPTRQDPVFWTLFMVYASSPSASVPVADRFVEMVTSAGAGAVELAMGGWFVHRDRQQPSGNLAGHVSGEGGNDHGLGALAG